MKEANATPHTTLLAELMNPNNPKNEREHAAVREIERLQEALAQPEQEPVAYPDGDVVGPCICGSWPGGKCLKCPRIATPPQRKPLSDEELFKIWLSVPAETEDRYAFARAVEAAHGIKEKNT